jgi:hypothetical protein
MSAADDPADVGRFEEVTDHHLGTGGPQGSRPVVLAVDQGADREPALEEQASHGSPNRPELTGRPGDEDRPVMLGAHDDSPGEVAVVWSDGSTAIWPHVLSHSSRRGA